jgi:hypothetical protein
MVSYREVRYYTLPYRPVALRSGCADTDANTGRVSPRLVVILLPHHASIF